MIHDVLVLVAIWGHYHALTIFFRGGDVLRLRTMMSLAVAFSAMSLAVGPGALVAAAVSLAACRLRPELSGRPLIPLLLLMLTPAAVVCLTSLMTLGVIDIAPASKVWSWLEATAPTAICLAAFSVLTVGIGWRTRLFTASVAASIVCAAMAQEPIIWASLILASIAAGWRATIWREYSGVLASIRPALAVALFPAITLAAQAGPWTQKKGDELLIARAPVSSPADADGAFSVQTYGEAGLSDDVTMVTSGFQETSGRRTKIGGSAGLRLALWRDGDWVVSGEASAGVEPFSLNMGGDWAQHAQGDVKLLAGWSGTLDDLPVYAGIEAGWRFRPAAFGDAQTVAISGGIDLAQDIQFNAHAALTFEPGGREMAFAQAGVLWRLDDWIGLELGVQTFSDGVGEPDTQAVAGVWLRF